VDLSPEVREAKYLKMINPSIGCFHVEAVGPECFTVEHAINWRAFQDINMEYNFSRNVTDSHADAISFYDNTSLFNINVTTGIINFTLSNAQVNFTSVGTPGAYWVNISVNDPYGAHNSSEINITLININDAPRFLSDINNQSWNQDTTLTGLDLDSHFRDIDADALTFSINGSKSSNSSIAITIDANNVVTFTPLGGYTGTEYVFFVAADSVIALPPRGMRRNACRVSVLTLEENAVSRLHHFKHLTLTIDMRAVVAMTIMCGPWQ